MPGEVKMADSQPANDFRIVADREAVSVWWAELDWSDAAIAAAIPDLSSDELERADRYHRPIDRVRFIAARSCLRRILGVYVDAPPHTLTFELGPQGKPRLGANLAFHDVRFNLAHSGGLAVFAVAIGQELGVDLEWIRREVSCLEIARRIFAPAEQRAIEALTGEDRIQAFYRCWTRKEAYVKATGAGLSLPLDSFTVSVLVGNGRVSVSDSFESTQSCTLMDISPNAEFAATLALFDSLKPLPIRQFHWQKSRLEPAETRLGKPERAADFEKAKAC